MQAYYFIFFVFFKIGFGLKKNPFTFAVPNDTWEVPKYLVSMVK